MNLTWMFEEGDEGLLIDDLYQCVEIPTIHIQESEGVFLIWECWDDMKYYEIGRFATLDEAKARVQNWYDEG